MSISNLQKIFQRFAKYQSKFRWCQFNHRSEDEDLYLYSISPINLFLRYVVSIDLFFFFVSSHQLSLMTIIESCINSCTYQKLCRKLYAKRRDMLISWRSPEAQWYSQKLSKYQKEFSRSKLFKKNDDEYFARFVFPRNRHINQMSVKYNRFK